MIAKCFSHSMGFTVSITSFDTQKFLFFMQFNDLLFLLLTVLLIHFQGLINSMS